MNAKQHINYITTLCTFIKKLIKKITKIQIGFIIQGNIYVADTSRGGIIGNSFPENIVTGIALEEIKETVLCKWCLINALGLDPYNIIWGNNKTHGKC